MGSVSLARQRWSVDSIDWQAIRGDPLGGDIDALFYPVAAASFMESTAERYTANLIEQFRGDDEVTSWLEQHWLPEEIEHGRALRRYVEIVWPDFDWDGFYDGFLAEFEAYCAADELEPTRAREMASRCVVEAGTAAYYTTLSRFSREPILAFIARRIADDETRHYKYFYRYFCKYQMAEPTSRPAVVAALFNRLRMTGHQDSVIAVKHLYQARHPGEAFDNRVYRSLRRDSRLLTQSHFPYRMCVQMILKPLGLSPRARRIVVPVMEALARRVVP